MATYIDFFSLSILKALVKSYYFFMEKRQKPEEKGNQTKKFSMLIFSSLIIHKMWWRNYFQTLFLNV